MRAEINICTVNSAEFNYCTEAQPICTAHGIMGSGGIPFRRLAPKMQNLQKLSVLRREFGASVDMEKQKGERYMQDIIIALLAVYAVWSAHKIMRMSAVLHILVRMLEEMLEEETQDLTNSADRIY